jgi:hypothetical protein
MNSWDSNVANQILSTKMASQIYIDQAFFHMQNIAVAFVCNQAAYPMEDIDVLPVADYAWQIREPRGLFVAWTARMDESGPYTTGEKQSAQ